MSVEQPPVADAPPPRPADDATRRPPLRVLLVTDSYPPMIGGADRSTQLLAHALAARGHAVAVATAWQHGVTPREDSDGVEVHRLHGLTFRLPWLSGDPYKNTPPPFPDPETVWRFRRLLRRFRPDVVHAYGWLAYSCSAAMLGSDVPLVLTERDYGHVCAIRTLVRDGRICEGPAPRKCLACARGLYGTPKAALAVTGVLGGRRLLTGRAAGYHSVSGYVHDTMARHLIPAGERDDVPVRVIPNFHRVSPDEHADPGKLALLPPQPYILFVGAFRRIKGLEVLFAAYERLVDPPPLVLIGTRAPDTPPFPAGVTVVESASHGTVMAAWQRALFGVAPSILPEALGNVVHEGMSVGRAVIGTTPGGHTDMIVDGESGLLVPVGDVDALAAAMRRLVEQPDLRARLGAGARVRAERFTAEVVVPQFERLYADVLTGGGR